MTQAKTPNNSATRLFGDFAPASDPTNQHHVCFWPGSAERRLGTGGGDRMHFPDHRWESVRSPTRSARTSDFSLLCDLREKEPLSSARPNADIQRPTGRPPIAAK